MDEITIVDVPGQKVLGTTKKGSYALIPELLMNVYEFAQKKNAAIAGPPVFVCHETSPDAVKEANEKGTAKVEIAWPVSGAVKGNRQIRSYDLPGGKMAHAIHRGPYAECEPAYLKLFAWIAERNLTIAGPVREVYVNDPREVKPEEIITEIYVPVK
jgi:effector-binding domain-containing protein